MGFTSTGALRLDIAMATRRTARSLCLAWVSACAWCVGVECVGARISGVVRHRMRWRSCNTLESSARQQRFWGWAVSLTKVEGTPAVFHNTK